MSLDLLTISYAAFLRGIGPGDPKKSNESLCNVFKSLGFKNVRSFISSGNILFESLEADTVKIERHIEQAFRDQLGIEIPTIIRSHHDLKIFLDKKVFGNLQHSQTTYLTVTLLKKELTAKGQQASHEPPTGTKVITFDTQLNALCAVTNTTMAKTPDFMRWVEREIGKGITTRTVNTLERVLKKLAQLF